MTSHQMVFVRVRARELWSWVFNTGVFFQKGYSLKGSSCHLNIYTFFFSEVSFISYCLLFLTNSCRSFISLVNQLRSIQTHSTDIVTASDRVNIETMIFAEPET